MQPIPATYTRNGQRDLDRIREAQQRRLLRIGLQFFVVLCVFAALSGCMRQDYHFIGHMMDTDVASARQTAGGPIWAAQPKPEKLAASPAAAEGAGGRG